MDAITLALIKALGGGGGGSSGGGVLVVHKDVYTGALDKTWQEIHDAGFAVLVFSATNFVESLILTYAEKRAGGKYAVCFCNLSDSSSDIAYFTYVASSADGYPVVEE